jgi:hypothetical protein
MIIPGTYRDISPYLEIAADELLYLYHHGCENDPDIGAMLLNFQADHKGMVLTSARSPSKEYSRHEYRSELTTACM